MRIAVFLAQPFDALAVSQPDEKPALVVLYCEDLLRKCRRVFPPVVKESPEVRRTPEYGSQTISDFVQQTIGVCKELHENRSHSLARARARNLTLLVLDQQFRSYQPANQNAIPVDITERAEEGSESTGPGIFYSLRAEKTQEEVATGGITIC
jgi:hypothetical protein